MLVVYGLCAFCVVSNINMWFIMMLPWLKSVVSPFEDGAMGIAIFV